jgi:hypothetical protein
MLRNRIFDYKGKAFTGAVGLLIWFVVFLVTSRTWPPKESIAQPRKEPGLLITKSSLDSSKQALIEYTNQKKSENLDKAIEVLKVNAEVKSITSRKRKVKDREVPPGDQTIILKYNGGVYEWPATKYEGQLLINLDSVLVDIEAQEDILITEPIYNQFDTAMIQTANEQISAWKKFKNLFKRKR